LQRVSKDSIGKPLMQEITSKPINISGKINAIVGLIPVAPWPYLYQLCRAMESILGIKKYG